MSALIIKKPNCKHDSKPDEVMNMDIPRLNVHRTYCFECFIEAIDELFEHVPSKCDHEMETSGSGTYCIKPDCDVNWV